MTDTKPKKNDFFFNALVCGGRDRSRGNSLKRSLMSKKSSEKFELKKYETVFIPLKKSVRSLDKMKNKKSQKSRKEEQQKKSKQAIDPTLKEQIIKETVEENILVASWVDDFSIPQQELESRRLFYQNESLLVKQDVREHFNPKNAKKFYA